MNSIMQCKYQTFHPHLPAPAPLPSGTGETCKRVGHELGDFSVGGGKE